MIILRARKKTAVIAAGMIIAVTGLVGASTAHAAGADFDPAQLPDLGTCGALSLGAGYITPNPCVASLQESLIASGFTQLGEDGVYGKDTWTAVYNFQQARGLAATGNADAQTVATVDQIANSPAAMGNNGATASGDSQEYPEAPEVTVPDEQEDEGPQVGEAPDDELFAP